MFNVNSKDISQCLKLTEVAIPKCAKQDKCSEEFCKVQNKTSTVEFFGMSYNAVFHTFTEELH